MSPEKPNLRIVPPVQETLVAREDGGNPLLNTPEEVAIASAQQEADGRTADLQAAMDTYNAEQPFVNAPEAAKPLPQSEIDSQNLISAAADSVRKWSENVVQQPQPIDPAKEITVPDHLRPQTPPQA